MAEAQALTVTANDDYIQCHGLYVKIRKKNLRSGLKFKT